MRGRSTLLRLGERGEAAAIEMMAVLAFLMIPTLIGLIQIPRWVDARSTAELAASEAARQMVLAPSFAVGAVRADNAVIEIVVNHGWDPSTLLGAVAWTGSADLVAGEMITATVMMRVPSIVVPFVGSFHTGATFTADHTEIVDFYREFDP